MCVCASIIYMCVCVCVWGCVSVCIIIIFLKVDGILCTLLNSYKYNTNSAGDSTDIN